MNSNPGTSDPKATLFVTRILWAALLMGQIFFFAMIPVLWSNGVKPSASNASTVQLLFLVSIMMLIAVVPLSYVIRMQTYKRGWVEDVVTPQAYLTGNLILLAMFEGVSFLSLVTSLINGSFWPTLFPAVLAMAMQVINFPNGRAMRKRDPLNP